MIPPRGYYFVYDGTGQPPRLVPVPGKRRGRCTCGLCIWCR